MYFTDKDSPFVFRLDPDGYLQAIAGTGVAGVTGDGGPATAAKLHEPTNLVVSREGSVYVRVSRVDPLFPTVNHYGIRRITSDGRIDAVVGRKNPACPSETYCGDGGNASAAHLKLVRGLSLSLDGALYLSMPSDNRIVRVRPRMPGAGLDESLIPSEDGREVYVFGPSGRHDRTVDAVLGTTLLEFGYDGALLETITDRDGHETTIHHDGNGEPTKIVGPHGHETLLETNGDGYLSEIADPLSQAFTLAYDPTASGLLTSLTNPRGHEKIYEYDAFGMLEKANDPPFMGNPLEGGWKSFARTDHGGGQRSVTMTTAGGRTATYFLGRNPDGSTYRQVVGRDGLLTTTRTDAAGVSVVQSPCGLTCQPKRGGLHQRLAVLLGPVHRRPVRHGELRGGGGRVRGRHRLLLPKSRYQADRGTRPRGRSGGR